MPPAVAAARRRIIAAVEDELRRRLGATFSLADLARVYEGAGSWYLDLASRVAPRAPRGLGPRRHARRRLRRPSPPRDRRARVTAGSRRRRRPRKITLALALVLAALALVAGILVGYSARGDSPPGGMLTEDRSVPVVTVTVPAEP